MKYTAQSVSLRYIPGEDRLQWISHCSPENIIGMWVTRRLLSLIAPQFADWLGRNTGVQQASAGLDKTVSPPAKSSEVKQFEHEVAVQQVKSVEEKKPDWAPDANYLMVQLGLKATTEGKAKLTLVGQEIIQSTPNTISVAAEPIEIQTVMTAPELHKIINELLRLAQQVHWGVANPWQEKTSTVTIDTRPVH